MNTDRLDELLDKYFDEGLSQPTNEELGRMLLAWPQARTAFWERARLNALLRRQGMESWGQQYGVLDFHPANTPTNHFPTWSWSAGLAACLAVALLATGYVVFVKSPRPGTGSLAYDVATPPESSQPDESGARSSNAWIAVLRKAIDVQWESVDVLPRVGEPLAAQRLAFSRGLVEIQTNRGATILLEGPADIELLSDMEVNCRLGRLRVDVPPPAHGFLVHSPLVNVVDRGTSFAMDVSRERASEVHVIDGAVEWSNSLVTSEIRHLKEGEAVSIPKAGDFTAIPARAAAFPTAAEAAERTRVASASQRETWLQSRSAFANDPACLVYFDFEEKSDQASTLRNSAKGASEAAQGTIVGCEWTEGRWPGKRALDFKQVTDRVRFAVPGEHPAITCLASVRLDSLDHAFNALLMSGDAVVGEIQWQISLPSGANTAVMRVGRRFSPGWGFVEDYRTSPQFPREKLGRWLHLAIVWDAKERVYRQYVDGMLVQTGTVRTFESSDAPLLRTGELEIGNWTPKTGDPVQPIRSFNGRMDEFAMFARALSSEEIQRHFQLHTNQPQTQISRKPIDEPILDSLKP